MERGSLVEQLIEPRRRRRRRGRAWRRVGASVAVLVIVAVAVVAAVVVVHRQAGTTPTYSLPTAIATGKRARTVSYALDVAYGSLPASTIDASLDRDRNLVGFRLTSTTLLGTTPISGFIDLAADRVTLPITIFQDVKPAPGVGWVSFGTDRWAALDAGALLDRATRDPLDVVRAFGALSGSVDLGHEQLDGETVDHVQVPGTTAALLATLTDLGSMVKPDAMPPKLVYDVWVSVTNELRRVQVGFVDGSTPISYDLHVHTIDW
jgi:hypothetical protein